MISRFCNKIAASLKKINPDETASIEVMQFSLEVLFNTISIIFLTIVSSLLLDEFETVLLAMVSFAILRMVSGGYHIKSSFTCIIISTTMLLIIPVISACISEKNVTVVVILSIIINLIYAPSNIENQTRIPKKYHILFKIISLLLVSSNFLIDSSVIAVSFFIQSLTLIRKLNVYYDKEVKKNAEDYC